MEKLTWLASERRVSQEGESEEENSQEDNSEPEEEEEEEADGVDSLQKEGGAAGGAVGGLAEKPPTPFASPEAAPEAETSRTPAGGFAACPGQVPVGPVAQRIRTERRALKPGGVFPEEVPWVPRSGLPQSRGLSWRLRREGALRRVSGFFSSAGSVRPLQAVHWPVTTRGHGAQQLCSLHRHCGSLSAVAPGEPSLGRTLWDCGPDTQLGRSQLLPSSALPWWGHRPQAWGEAGSQGWNGLFLCPPCAEQRAPKPLGGAGARTAPAAGGAAEPGPARTRPSCCCCTTSTSWSGTRSGRRRTWPSRRRT